MADFRVITDASGSSDNYGEDDSYSFIESILVVTQGNGNQRYYSPSGWLFLDVTQRPG